MITSYKISCSWTTSSKRSVLWLFLNFITRYFNNDWISRKDWINLRRSRKLIFTHSIRFENRQTKLSMTNSSLCLVNVTMLVLQDLKFFTIRSKRVTESLEEQYCRDFVKFVRTRVLWITRKLKTEISSQLFTSLKSHLRSHYQSFSIAMIIYRTNFSRRRSSFSFYLLVTL